MNYLSRVLNRAFGIQVSYAQCGEDLIVDFIFRALKKTKITYLDIGAHHPTYLSNTYLLYSKGNKGVCIEPDPILSEKIRRRRSRDTVLNIGIAANDDASAEFFIMTTPTLSTFSRDEAKRYESYGQQKVEKVIQVPCLNVNTIMKKYFPCTVDFVSIDVEGKDLEILQSFDFFSYRPAVFCLETLSYTEDKSEKKLMDIIDFMLSKNYFIYADTYINTIFVDTESWRQR